MTEKYTESTLRSKELLKSAIAFIGIHQLSANPVNYTVCYEYLQGNQPLLKQAIDQTISEKIPLTNTMMEQWFETWLADYDPVSLKQSQSDLLHIIATLTESTAQAEADVHEFAQALQHSEKALVDSHSSLENIVAYLLASTNSMQLSMAQMKQQIQESRLEITALQEKLERATAESLTDPLTGLTNRKGLTTAVEKLAISADTNSAPCLLMIDIDHFKKINDTFGHLLGDKVIQVVAETLKKQIKGKDTAARYGGEEFCVMLPETALKDAVKVADNIRFAIEKTRIKRSSDDQEICRVTISLGVARLQPGESITALFERADGAMYRSKNDGRNRVSFIE